MFSEGAGGGAVSSTDPTLGSFFKDVSAAPPGDLGQQVELWSSQINTFEARIADYDDLLNQMGSGSEAEADSQPVNYSVRAPPPRPPEPPALTTGLFSGRQHQPGILFSNGNNSSGKSVLRKLK